MKLEKFAPIADVMADFQSQTAKNPRMTIETAMFIARDCVRRVAMKNLAALVQPALEDLYNTHIMFNGELDRKADRATANAWSEDLEAQITEYFDNINHGIMCSATWLATVDEFSPRYPGDVEKLCGKFADEAYRNLTYLHGVDGKDKSAAQVLSSVGIVQADLEAYLESTANLEPESIEEPKTMQVVDINELVRELHDGAAMAGVEGKQLRAALDNASDDDDGLAQSGFGALFVDATPGAMQALREARMMEGFDTLFEAVERGYLGLTPAEQDRLVREGIDIATLNPAEQDANFKAGSFWAEGGTEEAPQTFEAIPDPKPAKIKEAPREAPKNVSGDNSVIPVSVLQAVKFKTGLKAEEIATGLGASRSTFENYVKGKGRLHATPQMRDFLLVIIEDHLKALMTARGTLNEMKLT